MTSGANGIREPRGDGGMLHVLRVAVPLILMTAGHGLKLFSDRAMLARVDQASFNAAMPAGVSYFMSLVFFIGVISYVNTFVAQYTGANHAERAGLAVWQGILLAAVAGFVLSLGVYWAEPLFRLMAHPEPIRQLEVTYYSILVRGAHGPLLAIAVSCFWSGRGKTWVVMAVNLCSSGLNILLNWLLIFGHGGLPEMGIAGAGLATILSEWMGALIYFGLFAGLPAYRRIYGTWPGRIYDAGIMRRLLRYGLPSGVHGLLDIGAFNTVIALMGRLGPSQQEAGQLAFTMNLLAFLPMLGMGMAVVILVGQFIGARDVPGAERAVRTARNITLIYMGLYALLLLTIPRVLFSPFLRPGDPAQAESIALALKLAPLVAGFVVVDGMWIIYTNAIKGAGDTVFAMVAGVLVAWLAMALPAWVVYRMTESVWWIWVVLVAHVVMSAGVFYTRYRYGPWRRMRVIEY